MDFSKETIFTGARSHKKFDGKALSDDDIRAIYELTKLAPTGQQLLPSTDRFREYKRINGETCLLCSRL